MQRAGEAEPRVVLVTGSARGLGLEVARHLRAAGDVVHVVRRSPGPEAEASIIEFADRSHRGNLLHLRDARRIVDEVVAKDDGLDAVVHAVGEYVSGPLEDLTPVDLRRMLASNAETAFMLFDSAREHLRRRRGGAVFFGCAGLAGMRARTETAAYAAGKSALLVLVRAWAREEGPHGVRVNMVSPGVVPHDHAHPDSHDAERIARIPAGRAGEPAEVARAVEWLLSDDAAYTTGTDLQVGGGWML